MSQDLNRRKDDRHPTQPLQWDDKPDLLAMRAGVNEIQREIERARSAGLTMLALPIETANAACCYVAHLGERVGESVCAAPAEQASKQVPTIDTAEFGELLAHYALVVDASGGTEQEWKEARAALIAHIDAKLAGQPAAPVAATEQATDEQILRRENNRLREQLNQQRPAFLLNGTRFKLNFSPRGNVDVFHNYAAELQGRWVALVPAEDDMHLSTVATPADAGAGLTEAQISHIARQYFSERWAQDYAKSAIYDAFQELARLSTPAAPVTASQPAAQVSSRDSELIDRWASWIVLNRPLHFKDHACAQCVPHGDMLVDGFKCVFHEAKDVIGGIYPAAAHAAKEGGQQ